MRTTKKKLKIKNRKNQTVVVLVESPKKSRGLAFVMHGLGGIKEGKHIQVFAESFLESGFTTVRFDTTNSYGESDGKYEEATATNYYEDLEDVIKWAEKQDFYQEPFCLAGHSLGGLSIALFTQKYPEKVKALAPISTVVSGELNFEVVEKNELKSWEKLGYRIKESPTKPGLMKKLNWSFMENIKRHNLLDNVNKLSMPALMIVGENDEDTPFKHQKILFDRLPGPKELHVTKGAPHTFVDEKHLKEIKKIFKDWIKSNEL